jgi:hypothetical protein
MRLRSRSTGKGVKRVERLKGVVASHLDRFAFREAPLKFEWSGERTAEGEPSGA